ncbi:MAG: GerAB/ArcD/ProY family transporter [bacterium]|jgi:spore germination protein
MSKIARNDKLTSFQVFSVLAVALISIVGFDLPGTVGAAAGADGWLSLLLTGALTAAGVLIVINLGLRFPGRTHYSFGRLLLGRYLGTALTFAYVVYDVVLVSIVLRIYLDVSIYATLRQTPSGLIVFIMLALTVYTVLQGLLPIARLSEITVLLISVLGLTLTGQLRYTEAMVFLPVGSGGVGRILSGIIPSLPSFLGLHLLFVLLPRIHDLKSVKKTALAGVVFAAAYNTSIFLAVVGFYGIERTLMFEWPALNYVRTTSLPFVERVDIPILTIWMAVALVSSYMYFYLALTGLAETFGPRCKPFASVILAGVSYGLVTQMKNLIDIDSLTQLLVFTGIILDFILPAVLLALAAWRRKGVKT